MSLTPEELRRLAAEALMEARRAEDLSLRRQWLNVAGAWTALARELLIVSRIDRSMLEPEGLPPNLSTRTALPSASLRSPRRNN